MNNNKLNRIIKFYGKEAQKDVAIEEMSELTKELIKERRIKYNTNAILEEIADVSVMLQQLLMIYNFTEEDVNRIAEEKIERQLKRIKNIEQEPTADAVPVRHGKWIEYPECLKHEKAFAEEDIVCSCCGEVFNTLDNDTDRFKYCPNCGAKMESNEK